MILSRAGEYGVQISLHLALQRDRTYVPVRELAERCDIPFFFLGKICNRLTRAGILNSYKGPHGGVALARPAEEIALIQIVEAMDGLAGFDRCVLGLAACDDSNPCPLHAPWQGIKLRILQTLSGATLSQLARELSEGRAILRLGLEPRVERT